MIVAPPSSAGAVHAMVADVSDRVAVTEVGASGAVASLSPPSLGLTKRRASGESGPRSVRRPAVNDESSAFSTSE